MNGASRTAAKRRGKGPGIQMHKRDRQTGKRTSVVASLNAAEATRLLEILQRL